MKRIFLLLSLGLALPLASPAQDAEPRDVPVPEDLRAVLMLRGKPCERVERYERLGPSDYAVTCSGGKRYRIRIEDGERVVVEEIQ